MGRLDADSNRDCVPDGRQRESLVWAEAPESGTYAVHANLFDACGRPAVHFQIDSYTRADGDEPGTYTTVETALGAGSLLALHANGGERLGTFVTSFTVP